MSAGLTVEANVYGIIYIADGEHKYHPRYDTNALGGVMKCTIRGVEVFAKATNEFEMPELTAERLIQAYEKASRNRV